MLTHLILVLNDIPPMNNDPDLKHYELKSLFDFSEDRSFFNVYYVGYCLSNQTLSPSHTSRRDDYAHAKKVPFKALPEMSDEELAIINAVNLDDYHNLQKDRGFWHWTNLYKAGYLPAGFSMETYQKWYAYFRCVQQ